MLKTAYKSRGFTLIELLVVISIISLLMAILMPALSRVRASAKQIKCASQMKQWVMATEMYAMDNSGYIPYFGMKKDLSNPYSDRTYWYDMLAPYLTLDERKKESQFNRRDAYTTDYRRCPGGKYIGQRWDCWIGVNFGLANNRNYPLTAPFYYHNKLGLNDPLPKSSLTGADMLFLDAYTHYMYSPVNGDINGIYAFNKHEDLDDNLDSSTNLSRNYIPYNHARPKVHNDGCNVGLADGHVEYIKYRELWEVDENSRVVHSFWYVGRK